LRAGALGEPLYGAGDRRGPTEASRERKVQFSAATMSSQARASSNAAAVGRRRAPDDVGICSASIARYAWCVSQMKVRQELKSLSMK